MIRKLLLASTATALLTGAASAADLPRPTPPPVFTPVPVFTWTGFYAGFNAGYAFDVSSNTANGFTQTLTNPVTLTGPGGAPVTTSILPLGATLAYRNSERDGFSGGGQIGYNYQFTPGSGFVIGIEADAQYLDFGASRNNRFVTTAPIGTINPNFVPVNGVLSTLDFFGTVRGRIGYAWDRTLFYGTGGFAYASGDTRLTQFANVARGDDFLTGWTVGGGVEYALANDSWLNFFRASAVTLKVEGLYVNLDQGRGSNLPIVGGLNTAGGLVGVYNTSVAGAIVRSRRDNEFAVVRAGLNYKFGSY
ncbi:outer membrane immunogenic protein [Methylobacterium sp. BE186]|uniref:outer membrane protein n=1 Tax=Methylobacterium sp. BE186 TaxID=2817715 RepID=UPI002864DDC8|nr:porin family protein [Methylobacterium sp. BE186]MDR7036068.1 outer membrane immunogenic protein [Methylobacterium sp. BE186]